jgi:hypothetical protein
LWVSGRNTAGWTITYDEIKPVLFVDHVSLSIRNPKITMDHGSWNGDYLAVSQYFWDRNHFKFVVKGPNALQWNGQSWTIAAYPLRVNIRVSPSDGSIKDMNATANDMQIIQGSKDALFLQAMGVSLTSINVTDKSVPFAALIGTFAGLDFKSGQHSQTTPIAMFEVNGSVMGLPDFTDPGTTFSLWSSNGGTLEVKRFELEWPPVKIEGDGTIAFDQALQPVAAFASHIHGLAQLADNLRQTTSLSEADSDLLRTTAHKSAGESIPITVQNGKIWIGSVAIADQPNFQ